MNERTQEIEITAAPRIVWSVLEDVRRMPELSPSTTSVTAPERLTKVGDQFEQVVKVAGRSFRSTWTVSELVSEQVLAITGRVLPGTHYEMIERIDPFDGGRRTRLRLTMRWRLPFGPVGRLASRLGVEQRATEEASAVLHGVRRLAEAANAAHAEEAN